MLVDAQKCSIGCSVCKNSRSLSLTNVMLPHEICHNMIYYGLLEKPFRKASFVLLDDERKPFFPNIVEFLSTYLDSMLHLRKVHEGEKEVAVWIKKMP